jgi:hypothetical protein
MQLLNVGLIIVAIILAGGFAYGMYLLAVYAITSDHARHYSDGRTAGLRQARLEKDGLTAADLQTLLAIATTLRVAHNTWLPMQGTELFRSRVVSQLAALNKIATRIRDQVEPSQPMPVAVNPQIQITQGEAA